MKTYQLNARIDEKAHVVLVELMEKLHLTKGHLTEKAIYLLKEHFEKIEKTTTKEKAPDVFISLLSQSMDRYHELYEKLAQ